MIKLKKKFTMSNYTVEAMACSCACSNCSACTSMCNCPDVMNFTAMDGRYLVAADRNAGYSSAFQRVGA